MTGPDEYDALVDNNVYTNLMAEQNLRAAADVAGRYPEQADELGVDDRRKPLRGATPPNAMLIPFDERLGVHPQSEGYTEHSRWDFRSTNRVSTRCSSTFLTSSCTASRWSSRPTWCLAMQLRGDAFSDEQKARNFAYYEGLTVRDSSLSSGPQAVIAAEVGQLELAHDYIAETALVDLHDLNHNTGDGLHIASLASTWTALVAGFGGMRARQGRLAFAPRLPSTLTSLAFRLRYRGRRLLVTVTPESATYELLAGAPLTLHHHGSPFELASEPAHLDIPAGANLPRPKQPPGREPAARSGSLEQAV